MARNADVMSSPRLCLIPRSSNETRLIFHALPVSVSSSRVLRRRDSGCVATRTAVTASAHSWHVALGRRGSQDHAHVADRHVVVAQVRDGGVEDLHALHDLSEGAGEPPSGLVLHADVEEGVELRLARVGAHHEAALLLLDVLAAPLQVSRERLDAGQAFGSQVFASGQRLSRRPSLGHAVELAPAVGRPQGAQAESEEVLGAADSTPQADVDTAETPPLGLQHEENLLVVLWHQVLQDGHLREGKMVLMEAF